MNEQTMSLSNSDVGKSMNRRRFIGDVAGIGTGVMLGSMIAAGRAQGTGVEGFGGISVVDRLIIMERIAKYSWAIDSGDMDAYLDCFMEDATLGHPSRDGRSARFKGHAGIKAFLDENFKQRPSQTYGHQHDFSALVMVPEGRDVRVKAYCRIYRHEFHRRYWPSGVSWRIGTWHTLFGRAGSDWKIRTLDVHMWTDTAMGAGSAIVDQPPGAPGVR